MSSVDPRVERSRRLIREAALAELVTSGYSGLTIEAVAARAGVGRSTVYRHWAAKIDLLSDALEMLNEQPAPAVEGSARERVEQLVVHLATAFSDPLLSPSIPALIDAAERDGTVRAFHRSYNLRRRKALTDAIAAGVAAGDFPSHAEPELASAALAGAVLYRRVMTDEPLPPHDASTLVTTVLGPPSSGRVDHGDLPGRVRAP